MIARLLIALVRVYQAILSPVLPRSCKYHPSCSRYAIDALREYGAWRGSVLAVWRTLRCNPWSHGGYDPVAHQHLFRAGSAGLRASGPNGAIR